MIGWHDGIADFLLPCICLRVSSHFDSTFIGNQCVLNAFLAIKLTDVAKSMQAGVNFVSMLQSQECNALPYTTQQWHPPTFRIFRSALLTGDWKTRSKLFGALP